MPDTRDSMRTAWSDFECQREKLTRIAFLNDTILVAPPTMDAWTALAAVLDAHGYTIRPGKTDSYNCRNIKGTDKKSLHSHGIALDVNWDTNPWRDHAGSRGPKYSGKPTQEERAEDARVGLADTDMTEAMIKDVSAIATVEGKPVFRWGGNFRTVKDAMHFEICVTPDEIGKGIDWETVGGGRPTDEDHAAETAAGAGFVAASGGGEMNLPKVFFDTVRGPLFGGSLSQSAVNNMNIITGYWLQTYPDNPLSQLAYVLATVRAEVGSNMKPVREGFAASDADARRKVRNRAYGKEDGPFGHVYYGRGYVQLTWHRNYKWQSEKLGMDLEQFPDLALETPVAIRILVEGMMDGDFNGQGHGLAHYVNENTQDFVGARRTVNVQDRAGEIAGFARSFLRGLELAAASQGGRLTVAAPVFAEQPAMPQPTVIETIPAATPGAGAGGAVPAAIPDLLATGGVPVNTAAIGALLRALGTDPATAAKLDALLGALEKAGVVKPAKGLTPVNAALGETIGNALDGKKTVIGVVALITSVFLPQLAPLFTFLSNTTPTGGTEVAADAVNTMQSILMPLASLFTGWGALGKIDKWMHKPVISSVSDLLGRIRQ